MTTYVPPEADKSAAAPALDAPPPVPQDVQVDVATPARPPVVMEPPGPPAPPEPTGFLQPPGGERVIPGVPRTHSTYLDYLPGIYRGNEFLGRFLLIFESILSPIERTVDNVPHYFDPGLTPTECVAWLGSWLGLVLDERWPEDRRRELIRSAVELYQWRGTRRGLSEFIRLYTGITPEIVEPTLSEVSAVRNRAFRFTARLRVPAGVQLDRGLLQSIIDLEKPAFAACTLELIGD